MGWLSWAELIDPVALVLPYCQGYDQEPVGPSQVEVMNMAQLVQVELRFVGLGV